MLHETTLADWNCTNVKILTLVRDLPYNDDFRRTKAFINMKLGGGEPLRHIDYVQMSQNLFSMQQELINARQLSEFYEIVRKREYRHKHQKTNVWRIEQLAEFATDAHKMFSAY